MHTIKHAHNRTHISHRDATSPSFLPTCILLLPLHLLPVFNHKCPPIRGPPSSGVDIWLLLWGSAGDYTLPFPPHSRTPPSSTQKATHIKTQEHAQKYKHMQTHQLNTTHTIYASVRGLACSGVDIWFLFWGSAPFLGDKPSIRKSPCPLALSLNSP